MRCRELCESGGRLWSIVTLEEAITISTLEEAITISKIPFATASACLVFTSISTMAGLIKAARLRYKFALAFQESLHEGNQQDKDFEEELREIFMWPARLLQELLQDLN